MNCIILGDKYSKRMKSKGCCALIEINKKYNILENQYYTLKSIFPKINIVYVYGFENTKFLNFISKKNLEITTIYNINYNKYNQSYSLNLAKSFLNNDTLILDGYSVLSKSMIKKINNKGNSQILISNNINKYDTPGCVIVDKCITNFSFDLDNNIKNIYYLDKISSNILYETLNENNYNYFIFELLNKIIQKKQTLKPIMV
jgi:hypothetical protein